MPEQLGAHEVVVLEGVSAGSGPVAGDYVRFVVESTELFDDCIDIQITNMTAAVEACLAVGFDGAVTYSDGAVAEETFRDVEREDLGGVQRSLTLRALSPCPGTGAGCTGTLASWCNRA